jgi:hypothetical protein
VEEGVLVEGDDVQHKFDGRGVANAAPATYFDVDASGPFEDASLGRVTINSMSRHDLIVTGRQIKFPP